MKLLIMSDNYPVFVKLNIAQQILGDYIIDGLIDLARLKITVEEKKDAAETVTFNISFNVNEAEKMQDGFSPPDIEKQQLKAEIIQDGFDPSYNSKEQLTKLHFEINKENIKKQEPIFELTPTFENNDRTLKMELSFNT